MNRSDMCLTGEYLERGIKGMNGYQTECVVDKEQYVVHSPGCPGKSRRAVRTALGGRKSDREAVLLQQARLPEPAPRTPDLAARQALPGGRPGTDWPAGRLGAAPARAQRCMGWISSIRISPRRLADGHRRQVPGRAKVQPDQVDDQIGEMDLIFESTGVASLEFNLLDALGTDGLYVITGIPGGDRPLELSRPPN